MKLVIIKYLVSKIVFIRNIYFSNTRYLVLEILSWDRLIDVGTIQKYKLQTNTQLLFKYFYL